MLLTSWVLSKLDNYSFILKSLDPMMKCAWIAIYNISEQCSKRPHKRLIRFFLGFKSEKKFSGKKDVLDQLLPAFPVSHPQSCWSSLVQVRIITKQQKVKEHDAVLTSLWMLKPSWPKRRWITRPPCRESLSRWFLDRACTKHLLANAQMPADWTLDCWFLPSSDWYIFRVLTWRQLAKQAPNLLRKMRMRRMRMKTVRVIMRKRKTKMLTWPTILTKRIIITKIEQWWKISSILVDITTTSMQGQTGMVFNFGSGRVRGQPGWDKIPKNSKNEIWRLP